MRLLIGLLMLALGLLACEASSSKTTFTPQQASLGTSLVGALHNEPQVQPDPSLSYLNYAKPVMDTACTACHAEPTAAAPTKFRLDSYYDVNGMPGVRTLSSVLVAKLKDTTSSHFQLPAIERQKLLAWLAAGAPFGGVATTPGASGPTAIFVKPVLPNEEMTALTVTTEFQHVSRRAVWDLFYTDTPGATSGGVSIALDLPASVTTYTWDKADLPASPNTSYYLYLVLRDGQVTRRVAADASVVVDMSMTR